MKIKPSEKLQKIIDSLASPTVKRAILARAAQELLDRAAVYPEEGAWNSPSRQRWYQRHFGTRYRRKDGVVTGRNTSERLQKSWQIEDNETSASIWTAVSYAPFLYDQSQRASWAAEHGWLTGDEILEEYYPRFEAVVLEEIDNADENMV